MLMHFGMTGRLRYFREMDKDPPHDRFLISFEAGYHLVLDDGRMFGKVGSMRRPSKSCMDRRCRQR
jgi:formamidopyrimidine-DNA glycosylase